MVENTVILRLDNVSKSFAKVEHGEVTHALNEVNPPTKSGGFISLVRPLGCGKPTILRLVAGLIPPTTGYLTVSGAQITGPSSGRGTMFQKSTLLPWLTMEKNISFSLKLQRRLKGNEEKVERMPKIIGLEPFRNDYPGQFSGGMAQRASLVRSLINEPDILPLDEPLGALDALTRMSMQDEILKAWQEKKQLALVITHDVDKVIYMGTRVIAMDAYPGRAISDIKIDQAYLKERSSQVSVARRNETLNCLYFGGKNRGQR